VSQDPTLVRAGQYLHRAGLLRGLHQRHPRRHHVPRPLRDTGLLFEYSLCFPRACLGLKIVHIYQWLNQTVFAHRRRGRADVLVRALAKIARILVLWKSNRSRAVACVSE
jgi:hypothetical protein